MLILLDIFTEWIIVMMGICGIYKLLWNAHGFFYKHFCYAVRSHADSIKEKIMKLKFDDIKSMPA